MNCFVALFHAMLSMLPFGDARVYIPTAVAECCTALTSQVLCPYRQHPFLWNSVARTSVWAFSTELATAFVGGLRILVICADQGTEIWGLVQVACLLYAFRMFYQPDPLHALSGVFANSLSRLPRYFKAVMGVTYVAKYTRAPIWLVSDVGSDARLRQMVSR